MALCFTDPAGDCDVCVEQTITDCDTITIASTNLTPSDVFWSFIVDRFGNQFPRLVVINSAGGFSLIADDYPSGLFTVDGGEYELFISVLQTPITFVSMTIGGTATNCVLLTFSVNCCHDPSILVDENGQPLVDLELNNLIDG